MIKFGGDGVAVALGERAEVCAFGEVLADQSVGVFVCAAFPGLVWMGEVDGRMEVRLQVFIHVEFRAVVGSDGEDVLVVGAQ